MPAEPAPAAPAASAPARPRGRWLGAWPSLCAVCQGWGRGRVCGDCLTRFAVTKPRCRRCALAVADGVDVCGTCLASPPPFDAAVARVDYGYPWDRLVTAFKFHAALDLAPVFAEALSQTLRAARPDPAALPLVLPVPLSEQRLRERGYNQAWEIGRRVARRIGAKADARLLLRLRDTPHQLDLPPERRAANVRGAFAVEPRRRAELRGRSVAIVDDVLTTGSTACELARALKDAGAAHVAVWVVARTPRPGDA